jgi:hypothetical protein
MDSERTPEHLTMLFAVMKNFVVVRAEYDFSSAAIEYTAISPLFDKVPEGQRAPEYEITVTPLTDFNYSVYVTKVEQ